MAATYPQNVVVWPDHKNQTEIIDAGQANGWQSEIEAVQTVLGTMPHVDPTLNGVSTNYGTVRQRFEQISRGQHIPVCYVGRRSSQQNIPNAAGTHITWDNAAQVDPYNMFTSGTDIVIPKTGWYVCHAMANFGGGANGAGNSVGARFVMLNWANARGTDMTKVASWYWLNGSGVDKPLLIDPNLFGTSIGTAWAGKLTKGAVLKCYVWQSSGTTIGVNADMSATYVRDV